MSFVKATCVKLPFFFLQHTLKGQQVSAGLFLSLKFRLALTIL